LKLFITAIDTNIGKTIVSSVLCKGLGYAYWKPIQCGDLEDSDSKKVKELSPETIIYPEKFRLLAPMSPHEAARKEDVDISLKNFSLPQKDKLVIEGAGGAMVPINYKGDMMADIMKKLNAKVVVVFKNYLGSINHTILTIQHLKSLGLCVIGTIVIGDKVSSSENIIEKVTGVTNLGNLPFEENINSDWVNLHAQQLANKMQSIWRL